MHLNKEIPNLHKNGFILLKKALPKNFCNKLIERLKKLKPKIFVPNSKKPYGYGNLIEDKQYKKIIYESIYTSNYYNYYIFYKISFCKKKFYVE